MTKRKIGLLLIGVLATISLSYLAAALISAGRVDEPVRGVGFNDSANPGPSSTTLEDVEKTLAFWQRRASDNPQDLIAFTQLGANFILKARHTGDVANYGLAEKALRRAIDLLPSYKPARSYLTMALFAQHEFGQALDLARSIYDSDPAAWQALATMADVHLALGDYEEAAAELQALLEQSPSPPVFSRLAYMATLNGQAGEALRLMQKAVDAAVVSGGYQEELAWYTFQLGELYFNSGQLAEAASRYQRALELFPDYYLGLAGLAKVRAAQGEYAASIDLYQRAVAIIPQPDLLAALGDVYLLAGQPDRARLQYDTVEHIGRLAQINRQIYNRQLANFYSDHDLRLHQALKLATAELASRKDILGYDAAAWAYFKNGQLDLAQELIEQAMQLGTRDARLFYHAGMIAHAQGRAAEAQHLLSEALEINPYFDLLQARIARGTLDQVLTSSN